MASLQSTASVYEIVIGWTAPIDIYLLDDYHVPAGVLDGTVELWMADIDGNAIDFAGDVSIQNAAQWLVRVEPDAADFATAGNYRSRFKVTDTSGKVGFFPNGAWD